MNYLVNLFPRLVNLSAVASIVILFVLAARLCLKRAPKIFSYALWAIVLIRLLIPISIPSPVSAIPEIGEISGSQISNALPVIKYESISDQKANEQFFERREHPDDIYVQINTAIDAELYLPLIWLAGMAIMLVYSFVSYFRIRRRLRICVSLRDNIFIADDIKSPFVIGFIRPKIYLPCNLGEREQEYIILHEQHHIRRLDHIVKALAFLALTVHWFNPLVWVAFVLASKDMEMSCDEAVICKMGDDVRADYSASLLTLATGRRIIAGTPLAFGEGDTKGRIKNLGKWKKPAIWIVILSVLLCVIFAVCLLTNPTNGMHLYEIDDSRNYSDLLLDRETVTLNSFGKETTVTDLEGFLKALDEIKVSRNPISRSRSEDRDSSHQIVLDGRTYINFSWNYATVWIDNRVKPTYSYMVLNPLEVMNIFNAFFNETKIESGIGVDSNLNEPVEHPMPVSKPAVSFEGLEPNNTLVDEEWIDVSRSGAYMEYVIAYGDQAIILEVGLIAEDGTEIAHTVEDGSANSVFENIPIGRYRLFVRNVGYQNNLPGTTLTGGAMSCELVGGTTEDMPYDLTKVIYNLDEEKLVTPLDKIDSYYFWTNSTKIRVSVDLKTEFSGKVMLWTTENRTDWILIKEITNNDRNCEFSGLTAGTYYAITFEGLSDCNVTVDDGGETLLGWLSGN